MAFVSMTGFAESAGACDGIRWRWEAKASMAEGWICVCARRRALTGWSSQRGCWRQERFKRGSFQISLTVETQDSARGLRVDPIALASAVRLAREVAAETGLAPARIDGLLALKGVIVQEENALPDPVLRAGRDAAILKSLADTFDALCKARAGEGAKLANLMGAQVNEIAALTADAARLGAAQLPALRDRLAAQIQELLAGGGVPEERLAQEAALLALKADIREELDRLAAHVEEARALMASGEAVGRKLDFLSQEFNREANTLCSKSADIALTRIGLSLKAVIDQFREQAQNVE